MNGPLQALLVQGSPQIFHFLWPYPNKNNCRLSMQQKWDQLTLGRQKSTLIGPGPALVLQWTLPWPYKTPNKALYILALILHSVQQKWDQGTLGTERSTVIGSRTRLDPSMDPAMGLQYT